MTEKPVLVSVNVVKLIDYSADGIQLLFGFKGASKSVAFKLCEMDTPSAVARAFRGAADAIEGLEDESKWEYVAPRRRRRSVKK